MNSRPESRPGFDAPPRHPHAGRPLRPLERVTLGHVAVLLLGASWAFGGGADWARHLISIWGGLGGLITLAAFRSRARHGENVRTPVRWLTPWIGFNLLVLLSCLNPSFTALAFSGENLVAHTGPAHPLLPSTAHAGTTLEHLGLFDAIYLSCFNLLLTIRRRRALRGLLLVGVANAVVLSVFGTFQKLGSDGLYFGRVPSPNARFFATFVYDNHWAAYLVLLLAAGLGLLFFYQRQANEGRLTHSPVALGLCCLGLMAITPLLAGSRAGVILVVILLGTGLVQVLLRLRQRSRAHGESAALPVTGLILCVACTSGTAVYLGRGALRERWQDTQGQWQSGILGERIRLYADTCRLAAAQPVFGWGLGSYGQVLQLIRPRPLEPNRQYEHSYVDAHSDWLQSFAEVGVVGTALLVLGGLFPLIGSGALRHAGVLPGYLLGGCGLIVLYAGVEFPFGNPAVVIAFWTCFFSAVHYCRLSQPQRRPAGAASRFVPS